MTCPCHAEKACTECGGTGWDPKKGTHPCEHAGKGGASRPSLIDADIEQAAMGIRGAAAAIDNTIFRDTEPFDTEKAVNDIVGS